MSNEGEAPKSILDEIMEEMFQKLEEGDLYDQETIKKLRELAVADILIKGDNLLELITGGCR